MQGRARALDRAEGYRGKDFSMTRAEIEQLTDGLPLRDIREAPGIVSIWWWRGPTTAEVTGELFVRMPAGILVSLVRETKWAGLARMMLDRAFRWVASFAKGARP
jgi:hypothetical protein